MVEVVKIPDRYDLYVERSYLAYLQDWLRDAAAEFIGHASVMSGGAVHSRPLQITHRVDSA